MNFFIFIFYITANLVKKQKKIKINENRKEKRERKGLILKNVHVKDKIEKQKRN